MRQTDTHFLEEMGWLEYQILVYWYKSDQCYHS